MTERPGGAADADQSFMRRALELAGAGWGRVHPNPLVGAVVVRDGAVIGEGAHREFGGDHAEVEALRAAGNAAAGATLYVTLEPCSHHGKTPPCTDAILDAGIARVVYAVADPHGEAGGGAARLEQAGVAVTGGVEAAAARVANAPFLRPIETGRAFVALKFGMSMDGKIAAREGARTRITGAAAEAKVHRLRSGYDAVLVGGRTARIDDAALTVRHAPPPRVPPVRVVADPDARLPADSTLVRTAGDVPVIVLAADGVPHDRVRALVDAGVDVETVPRGSGGLDLDAALDRLYGLGHRTVLCEGGGRLGAALLAADRVDRLYIFQAPKLLGAAAVPAFPGGAGFRGRRVGFEALDEDVLITIDRSE